jgi:phage terminase small subunit
MRPFLAGLMRMWPISTRVNKPENDDPSIVDPIEVADEAFVQAYVSNGMNATEAYKAVYPKYGSEKAAGANAARLIGNDRIQARIAEIMRAGAERAEITIEKVLRELAALGFSDIGKVVRWRPEVVYEEIEDEDNPDKPPRQVLQSRVLVLDSATLPPEVRLAVAEVSQSPNGALRVKMHDKHGPLVSIGKHLGMFVDRLQIQERKQISAEPMSAEEWKRQFVREG